MKHQARSFLHTLDDDRVSLGLWLTLASPLSADVVAGSDINWALIDAEHSPSELGDILQQLRALEASTVAPVVRMSDIDPVMTKKLLDIGVTTLMIPMVETEEAARQAVAYSRYPPEGVRGVASAVRGNDFGRRADYYRSIHEEICLIAQIETVTGLDAFDEIVSVDGIDAVFLGPSDLAASAGELGRPSKIHSLIEAAARKARKSAIPIGTLASPQVPVEDCLFMGFNFVAIGSDAGLLRQGLDGAVAGIRSGSDL